MIIESSVQPAPGSRLAGELVAAEWVFRVAAEDDAGYWPLKHREETWYGSTFFQGAEQWLRVGKDWHHPGERGPSVRRFLAPADGRKFQASAAFAANRQGAGGWSYETTADGRGAPDTPDAPRLAWFGAAWALCEKLNNHCQFIHLICGNDGPVHFIVPGSGSE
ncbi:MAG: hypothetical protein ACOX1P_10095 [Thermoguttaceae bacterium]